MENVDEFNRWLNKMLIDAQNKLNMHDDTMGFILVEKGLRIMRDCYYDALRKGAKDGKI